jgi:hypothetical protein
MNERNSNADRKAIKREYKETYRPAGVYQLRNTTNGRVLVGSSANLPGIWNRLRMQLDAGGYVMYPELQQDWKALGGTAAFVFEVLEELEPPEGPGWDPSDDLAALQALWIEQLQPFEAQGYHRRPKS